MNPSYKNVTTTRSIRRHFAMGDLKMLALPLLSSSRFFRGPFRRPNHCYYERLPRSRTRAFSPSLTSPVHPPVLRRLFHPRR